MKSLDATCSNLEDTTVWVFYKVLETHDYSLLGPNGNEDLWMNIYDQFYVESGLKMDEFKDYKNLQDLLVKYDYIGLLINILERKDSNFKDCKIALKKLGYRYNEKKSLSDNLERFYKSHDVLYTKIEIIKSGMPDEDKIDKPDMWKEVVILKKHFKIDIDPKKTPCIEWIKFKKQLEEDVKASRLTNNKTSKARA